MNDSTIRDREVNESAFSDASWLNALTLAERAELLHANCPKATGEDVKSETAERLAEFWRSQTPFTNEALFLRRLETDGLTEPQFLRLLAEPVEGWRSRLLQPPSWLVECERAFCSPKANPASVRQMGFLTLIEPLIARGVERLREGIEELREKHAHLPFDPDAVRKLLFTGFDLPGRLMDKLGRTMVLELNVARLRGELRGQNRGERFENFIESLSQRERAISILREYPVLARQLVISIDHWVEFSLEFLRHLCLDWKSILATFAPEADPGQLVEAASSAGDSHRKGRSVVLLSFSSGFKLVYKPHSLSVDCHFGELLAWLNARGDHPPFRASKTLDGQSHGWVEFIFTRGCSTGEEVQRFYERLGGYLALLYVLDGVDLHCENLIAAGEHPVLIDLEALFHGQLSTASKPLRHAEKMMVNSVLNIGLLPQRIWTKNGGDGVDLSGFGGMPGQVAPDKEPAWENPETDEMRLIMEQRTLSGRQNRPSLGGVSINPQDYAGAVVCGFTSIYRLLFKHRDELLAAEGPIGRFAEDEVRLILRPTRTYHLMLHDSFHPDMLRDALERGRLFDRLWAGVSERPYLAHIIPAECADLHSGDIPVLTSRPDSCEIYTSTGEAISAFFEEPCIATVRRRLQGLNPDDLFRQIWFIRASLTSLTTGESEWIKYPVLHTDSIAGGEQLLAKSCAAGDELGKLALRDDEEQVSWLGVTFMNERVWSLLPLGLDLYDGIPGVALFLAYLGFVTKDDQYTNLARIVVKTLIREFDETQAQPARGALGIGAFSGLGGIIYALTHLGAVWNEPELLGRAESLVALLPPLIEKDDQFDIIAGAAGCILVCSNLYGLTSSRHALAAATQCGDHLVTRATAMTKGKGWIAAGGGGQPLTGFSHGAAGVACALLELASLTREERYRESALDAIAYERSLFLPNERNWPDLRKAVEQDYRESACMTAWCHGAPGIGLARLRSLSHVDDAEIRAEIHVALTKTAQEGFGYNHSLCHGDLGNIELLLEAARVLNEPRWHDHACRAAAAIVDSINQNGWLCGTPLHVETPGLMTGLAGIGYNLLRLAEPDIVPSVLSLAPPSFRFCAVPKRAPWASQKYTRSSPQF